jgi:hypothetical protein
VAGTGPELPIQAPSLTPPSNGLLLNATVIDNVDDLRWENGVRYAGDATSDLLAFDPCSVTSTIQSVFADAATTNGSATLTSATANFNSQDAGKTISGTGIPGSTTILSVESKTSITLSTNATATGTGVTITIAGRIAGTTRQATTTLLPFGLQAEDTCSAMGLRTSDYEGRARRALAAHESKGVEREFALGAIIAANRHLQDNTNTVKLNSGTAVSVRSSLASLCQAIADYNLGAGMIHARPYLVELWSSFNLLNRVNNKIYTDTGTLVVSGSGYTGGAPDGTAVSAVAEWAYVTDVLQVMRGPVEVFVPQLTAASVHKVSNSITTIAQCLYSVQGNFQTIAGIKVDTTSLA